MMDTNSCNMERTFRTAFGIIMVAILLVTGGAGTVQNVMEFGGNANVLPGDGINLYSDISSGKVDFDVTYIERTPRYDYDASRNNPLPGDAVTFIGHIRSWGNFTGKADYRWYLDGSPVADGVLQNLLPDEERIVELPWIWSSGNHRIRLVVDPANNINESSEINNAIEDRTDGIQVGFWVEQSVYDYFHEHQRELGIGSNSWEDWAQRQMRQWNLHNTNALYPISPQGVLDRVRIDKIVVVPDNSLPLAGGLASNSPDMRDRTVDMMWGFAIYLLNGSIYSDHTSLQDNAFYLEPSLIHELGHARYLIDNYGFDVHYTPDNPQVQIYENGELVAGSQLMPFIAWGSVLYYNQKGGIMSGPWDGWSPYEAGALNLIAGRRASQGNFNPPGNLGVFLQDLPVNNHLQFVDSERRPLVGASVRAYRAGPGQGWYGKTIDDNFDLEFTTNASGYINMSHNPFADGPIVHTYGNSNGIMVFRIAHENRLWYRFKEVTEFNIEYWRGNTQHAYYKIELPEPGSAADIEIRGYDCEIPNGDITPGLADHTDFGNVRLYGGSVTRQFVIRNRGDRDLNLLGNIVIGGQNASDFVLTSNPDNRIKPGTITTLSIKYSPKSAGYSKATVIVTSDDPDESTYQFTIEGRAVSDMIANDDIFHVRSDSRKVIVATGLLKNDKFPDGAHIDAIRVDGPAHGLLRMQTNGSFVYVPGSSFQNSDTFRYKISDGDVESNWATVTIFRR